MTGVPRFVDMAVEGDVDSIVTDNTIGLLKTYDPEAFPESMLVDPERLAMALIAVREIFDGPKSINLAVVHNSDRDRHGLALYPDDDRERAVIVPPRVRESVDEFDPAVEEVESP